jgi:hypothetical protein
LFAADPLAQDRKRQRSIWSDLRDASTILDPFAGTGSTFAACHISKKFDCERNRLFDGSVYTHRESTQGDLHLYEDLVTINRSPKLIDATVNRRDHPRRTQGADADASGRRRVVLTQNRKVPACATCLITGSSFVEFVVVAIVESYYYGSQFAQGVPGSCLDRNNAWELARC